MKYTIKTCEVEGDNKVIGFNVVYKVNNLMIDKRVPLKEGKTDEAYITDAYNLAKPEIDKWVASFEQIGKEWNPETNSFVS